MPKKTSESKKPRVRYPWVTWFERGQFKLIKGTHYQCSTYGMMTQVRNVASSRGESVTINVNGDSLSVLVHKEPRRK